ncbi:phage tail assembly chaperone [Rhizorhapis sp. SPR117]|uniref:phage tail assembly chaperone n=1 Tax=Rhizorhapis sp. SPR117 TaxID=2912611 RepID=UPI001F3DDE9C|nr:phage tail assembly chaperone [Rhizorhapis sp. SPR117]
MALLPHPNPSPEGEGLFVVSATRLSAISTLMFGWRPAEFWAATPVELHGIFAEMERVQAGDVPPDTVDLANLMEMFPDG